MGAVLLCLYLLMRIYSKCCCQAFLPVEGISQQEYRLSLYFLSILKHSVNGHFAWSHSFLLVISIMSYNHKVNLYLANDQDAWRAPVRSQCPQTESVPDDESIVHHLFPLCMYIFTYSMSNCNGWIAIERGGERKTKLRVDIVS